VDYNITVTGTCDDTDNPDVEEELLEQAQEFVGGLEGVTAASFSSPSFMNIDLTEEEDSGMDETTAEPGTETSEPTPKPDDNGDDNGGEE
jgi:hypothetical protein